jgi:ADP-ribose pyrophosphatase
MIMTEGKLIYRGKRISLIQESYALSDGRVAEHLTVEHPGAVVILPRDAQGRFLLVRQYRHSVRQSLLEAPAGALEIGEDPRTCAERELREEIGESAKSWRDLGKLFPTPGFCNEVQYLYLATDLVPDRLPSDDDEEISVVALYFSEIIDLIRSGELLDGKTLAILMRAQALGLIE